MSHHLVTPLPDEVSGKSVSRAEAIDSLFIDPAAKLALFLVTATAQTDRMIAQQIGFTVSPFILADHGTILAEYFAEF